VRELENAIEYAVAVCSNHLVRISDLPEHIIKRSAVSDSAMSKRPSVSILDDTPTLDELNRRYIRLILAETGGNKSRAAEILSINRRTLYRYLDLASDDAAEERDGNEITELSVKN
jgi:DNA-binding NtrC family response regulator